MYIVCAVPTLLLSSCNSLSFGDQSITYADAFKQLDVVGKFYVLFSNLTMFFQEWSLFLQANWQTGALSFTSDFNAGTTPILYRLPWDAPAWSLSIELVFYLIAPFVVRSPVRVICFTVASLAVRIFTAQLFPLRDPWGGRFMPSELCMFGFGSLAYHFHRKVIPWAPAAIRRSTTTMAGIIGLCFLIVAIMFHRDLGGLLRSSETLLIYSPVFLLAVTMFVGPIFCAHPVEQAGPVVGRHELSDLPQPRFRVSGDDRVRPAGQPHQLCNRSSCDNDHFRRTAVVDRRTRVPLQEIAAARAGDVRGCAAAGRMTRAPTIVALGAGTQRGIFAVTLERKTSAV